MSKPHHFKYNSGKINMNVSLLFTKYSKITIAIEGSLLFFFFSTGTHSKGHNYDFVIGIKN